MFTLTLFDGTHQHIRDKQAQAVAEELAGGKKHIVIEGCIVTLSAIAHLKPSKVWLDEQRDKIRLSDGRICDFGSKHGRGEECRCVDDLKIPLTPEAARNLAALLAQGKADGKLTARGAEVLRKGYAELLAAAYPDLPPLLS